MLDVAVAPQPVLATERLVLRPLRDADAPAIAAGAGDKRVARYLIQVPSPYPVALARRWLRGRIEWWADGRGLTLAIAARDLPDELIGTVSLRRYARDRRGELGYWLASGVWGRGVATEATRELVDYGFRELELSRIYAQVLAGNTASERVLDKLGMQREGVQRQHVRKGRHLRDLVNYGLLRSEWESAA
jgi:[ribosomal protein S5]-alanine N-acetyltransferase